MNTSVLIDSIVRQTTVLIAQLATSAGGRTQLAHTANQVFLDLVKELKHQGLGNKVIADMFGMALRSYHSKIQRLSESNTYRGRSLWEVVLEYVQARTTVLRADVLRRFQQDDSATLRAVLKDLVETGMLFQTGRGDSTAYRAASAEELALAGTEARRDGLESLVWVAVNRHAPATLEDLQQVVPLDRSELERVLAALLANGRISEQVGDDGPRYACPSCLIPLGSTVGWEAAVFDHYQAMVTALTTKLRMGSRTAQPADWVGGSTYGIDVWPGHPLRDEVLGLLRRFRQQAVELRTKVENYNQAHGVPTTGTERVIAYVGQTVVGLEEEGEE